MRPAAGDETSAGGPFLCAVTIGTQVHTGGELRERALDRVAAACRSAASECHDGLPQASIE
ncbi:MAG TPA: hypothetical protein VML55_20180 [Planctomycetaceae bacterium]|nr:hypothetical protein [Planctomycetaceae bacterium]